MVGFLLYKMKKPPCKLKRSVCRAAYLSVPTGAQSSGPPCPLSFSLRTSLYLSPSPLSKTICILRDIYIIFIFIFSVCRRFCRGKTLGKRVGKMLGKCLGKIEELSIFKGSGLRLFGVSLRGLRAFSVADARCCGKIRKCCFGKSLGKFLFLPSFLLRQKCRQNLSKTYAGFLSSVRRNVSSLFARSSRSRGLP